ICWFEDGITDSIAGPLTRLTCLGFVTGSNCPHYDSEKERRPFFQSMVKSGAARDGHAADDGVALHFIDGDFIQAVANRPKAMAWSVRRLGDDVREEAIEPTRLG
ncbi:MAG: Type 1 glutamine amidotransferase-like domain-containing protein, partial [Betaproteobacteria bacterium]